MKQFGIYFGKFKNEDHQLNSNAAKCVFVLLSSSLSFMIGKYTMIFSFYK